MTKTVAWTESEQEMFEALLEAEAGLLFAGADVKVARGAFMPTPLLALRNVRTAIAQAEARGGKRPPDGEE